MSCISSLPMRGAVVHLRGRYWNSCITLQLPAGFLRASPQVNLLGNISRKVTIFVSGTKTLQGDLLWPRDSGMRRKDRGLPMRPRLDIVSNQPPISIRRRSPSNKTHPHLILPYRCETQVSRALALESILETSLAQIIQAYVRHRLKDVSCNWENKTSAMVFISNKQLGKLNLPRLTAVTQPLSMSSNPHWLPFCVD
jgi:hypothetical protein